MTVRTRSTTRCHSARAPKFAGSAEASAAASPSSPTSSWPPAPDAEATAVRTSAATLFNRDRQHSKQTNLVHIHIQHELVQTVFHQKTAFRVARLRRLLNNICNVTPTSNINTVKLIYIDTLGTGIFLPYKRVSIYQLYYVLQIFFEC